METGAVVALSVFGVMVLVAVIAAVAVVASMSYSKTDVDEDDLEACAVTTSFTQDMKNCRKKAKMPLF